MIIKEGNKPIYEEIINILENENFRCFCVVGVKQDGEIATCYFAMKPEKEVQIVDQAGMAFAIQQDAVMRTVLANADQVRRAADELEQEDRDNE